MFAPDHAGAAAARRAVEDVVRDYAENFGPFVMARGRLEPAARWDEFLERFGALVARFNASHGGRAQVESECFLITVDR